MDTLTTHPLAKKYRLLYIVRALVCLTATVPAQATVRYTLADYQTCIYDRGFSPDHSLEVRIDGHHVTVYRSGMRVAGPFVGTTASFGNTGRLLAVWGGLAQTETHMYWTATWQEAIPANRAGTPTTFWGAWPAFSANDRVIALRNPAGFVSIYCDGQVVYETYAPHCYASGPIACFGSYTTNIYDIARGALIAVDLPGSLYGMSSNGTLILCRDNLHHDIPSEYDEWHIYNAQTGQCLRQGQGSGAEILIDFFNGRLH